MKRDVQLVVVEGRLEVPASLKLLRELGLNTEGLFPIDKGGRTNFWKDVERYNQAAKHIGPIFGLADLETNPCPSGLLIAHLKHGRSKDFVLRIAEPMLESWLLADSTALADFLKVSVKQIPANPEALTHPKRSVVDAARKSKSRDIRDDLVPKNGSAGVVGPGYTPRMSEFIEKHWRPLEAEKQSQSLRKAIAAIKAATGT
jgi:hypothetical protein